MNFFFPQTKEKSGTLKIYDDIDNRSNIIYKPILCQHIGAITQNIGPETQRSFQPDL